MPWDPTAGSARTFTIVAAVAIVLAVAGGVLAARLPGEDEPAAAPTPAATPDAADEADEPAHGHGDGDPDSRVAHGGIPPSTDPETLPIASEREERADYEMDGDVKVFRLTAEEVRWELIPGTWIVAWAYNGQVPGPEIWVDQGDQVRIELTNELPAPTTIHWHGIDVPNEMDGVPGVTQDPIEPGETFVYEFEAKPSGTFWYHSHFDKGRQLDMGLAGAFIIRDPDDPAYDKDFVQFIDEWIRLPDGRNGWDGVAHAGHNTSEYNWFTINGKSFPATEDMVVSEGDRVRIRMINAGFQAHPMHLHGPRTTVIAKDGAPVPAPYDVDTVLIGAGERYDVEFMAGAPGDWMFHCHIPQHVENDAQHPGGLMNFVVYEGHENTYQQERSGR